MKQKFLIILVLALLAPAVAHASYLIDGMYYDIRNGEATLVNGKPNTGEPLPSEVVIPDSITVSSRTYPVTAIGVQAFYGRRGMTSVDIPTTIKNIQFSAFVSCDDLQRVNIHDLEAWCQIEFGNNWANPLYDGNYLYLNGEEVTDLVIPSSITEIKKFAFVVCKSLKTVTIPSSVTSIGYSAFMYCYDLEDVNISNSVTSIGGDAFACCKSLTSVNLPENLTTIEAGTFTWCTALTSIVIPDSVTTIGEYAFRECQSLASVNIPDGVTTICDQAFENCRITSVEFPYSLTSVGVDAFAFCNGLTSLHIPSTLVSIGEGAFNYCTGFTSITVDSDNPNYDSRGDCNALIETSSNILLWGCLNTVIPNTVVAINSYAFYRCRMTSIDIPNSVITIGYRAFEYCQDLENLTIGNSVTSIAREAFDNCTKINSIHIPNSVTTIDVYAFRSCGKATELTIGCSLDSLGEGAFNYCSGLTSITVASDNPKYDSRDNCNALIETATNTLLYGSNNTVIPNTVTAIADRAFVRMKDLKTLTIPGSVATIGYQAFYSASVANLTLCEGITTIGDQAFYYCEFPSITIPNSVTSVGTSGFSSCNNLLEATIGNGITTVPGKMFMYCWQLEKVTIGNAVDSIGSEAFNNCGHLIDVTCLTATPPKAGDNVFKTYEATLRVPASSVEAYRAAYPWSEFANIVGFIYGGDLNDDGMLNISDVTELISLLLTGDEYPSYADVNGDGVVNISDVTELISYLLNE